MGCDGWVAKVPCDGLVGKGEKREFWVMGGYGESRTVSGVFPVDEYYKDGVVLELKKGRKWREIGDMWQEGERHQLGKVVVVDGQDGEMPGVFMLDGSDIFSENSNCSSTVMGKTTKGKIFPIGNKKFPVSISAQDLRSLDMNKEREYESSPRGVLEDC